MKKHGFRQSQMQSEYIPDNQSMYQGQYYNNQQTPYQNNYQQTVNPNYIQYTPSNSDYSQYQGGYYQVPPYQNPPYNVPYSNDISQGIYQNAPTYEYQNPQTWQYQNQAVSQYQTQQTSVYQPSAYPYQNPQAVSDMYNTQMNYRTDPSLNNQTSQTITPYNSQVINSMNSQVINPNNSQTINNQSMNYQPPNTYYNQATKSMTSQVNYKKQTVPDYSSPVRKSNNSAMNYVFKPITNGTTIVKNEEEPTSSIIKMNPVNYNSTDVNVPLTELSNKASEMQQPVNDHESAQPTEPVEEPEPVHDSVGEDDYRQNPEDKKPDTTIINEPVYTDKLPTNNDHATGFHTEESPVIKTPLTRSNFREYWSIKNFPFNPDSATPPASNQESTRMPKQSPTEYVAPAAPSKEAKIDIKDIEASMEQNMKPIFDEAQSLDNHQLITDTLDDYESALVKEVMAALEETNKKEIPESYTPSNSFTANPGLEAATKSVSNQPFAKEQSAATLTENHSVNSCMQPSSSKRTNCLQQESVSPFNATYVPGEVLGYSSLAAHAKKNEFNSIAEAMASKEEPEKTTILDDASPEDEDEEEVGTIDNSPLNFSQWLGTICILLIPILNIIMLIVWSSGKGNENRVNYSRALLIVIGVLILFSLSAYWLFNSFFNDFLQDFNLIGLLSI